MKSTDNTPFDFPQRNSREHAVRIYNNYHKLLELRNQRPIDPVYAEPDFVTPEELERKQLEHAEEQAADVTRGVFPGEITTNPITKSPTRIAYGAASITILARIHQHYDGKPEQLSDHIATQVRIATAALTMGYRTTGALAISQGGWPFIKFMLHIPTALNVPANHPIPVQAVPRWDDLQPDDRQLLSDWRSMIQRHSGMMVCKIDPITFVESE